MSESVSEESDSDSDGSGPPLRVGDVVHDREDDDPDDAVIVNTPPLPASDWTITPLDSSLAEENPDYPDDARTIIVLYESDVDELLPDWDRGNALALGDLGDLDCYYYAFPAPRLERINAGPNAADAGGPDIGADVIPKLVPVGGGNSDAEGADGGTDDEDEADPENEPVPEPSEAVLKLCERLEDGGMTTELESDATTVAASKLGTTYRLRPGEVLEGDGPHRGRLEELVADFETVPEASD